MKTLLVDAAGTFVLEGQGIYKPLYDLLEKYPNRKIIVTNANDEQIIKYGLVNLPYELFTLKHNPDKTDPIYFKKLMEHYSLTTTDIVYFEHMEAAVESAKSVGITAYHYDNTNKNLTALKDFFGQ